MIIGIGHPATKIVVNGQKRNDVVTYESIKVSGNTTIIEHKFSSPITLRKGDSLTITFKV